MEDDDDVQCCLTDIQILLMLKNIFTENIIVGQVTLVYKLLINYWLIFLLKNLISTFFLSPLWDAFDITDPCSVQGSLS